MRSRHRRDEGGFGEAEDIDRLRTEFISTVSHELRTPVTALHGAALTLRKYHDIDEQMKEQLVELIETQSGRLCDLVEELLVAATLRARAAASPDEELVDLVEVVEAVARANTDAPPGVSIVLDVRVSRAAVVGSAQDLRRIVGAVLDHAIASADGRGQVLVSLAKSRRTVLLEVTGWGMTSRPRDFDRLFEPFARLSGPDAADGGGLGLSLFIAKELARGLGGKLTARWSDRDGCHLTVELPLVFT